MDFSKDNNHNTKKADEQQESEVEKEDKKEEQEEANNHDEVNSKITDSEKTVVITLRGSHLGSTDTEGIIEHETTPIVELKESKHVSFKDSDSSSTISTAPLNQSKGFIKVRTSASAPAIIIQHEHSVVKEQFESVLPHSEPDYMSYTERSAQSTQSNDTRIEHILRLFDHLTKNLETIENHLTTEHHKQSTKEPTKRSSSSKDDLVPVHKSHYEIHHEKGHHESRSSRLHRQNSCSSELRISQLFQLPQLPRNQQCPQSLTPLAPRSSYNAMQESGETNTDYAYMQAPSYIVDLTTNLVPTQTAGTLTTTVPNVVIKQPDLHKYKGSKQANRPPCERTFHTITISSNSPVHPPRTIQNSTWLTRCGDAFSDFATALCLCLQVNKDCVFCLGFFVAFVLSASFLTAFFYRTLNMTPQTIHIQQEGIYNEHHNPTTVRLSGFYYIYNRHHPMPN